MPRLTPIPELLEDGGWAYCSLCALSWRHTKVPASELCLSWLRHLRAHINEQIVDQEVQLSIPD